MCMFICAIATEWERMNKEYKNIWSIINQVETPCLQKTKIIQKKPQETHKNRGFESWIILSFSLFSINLNLVFWFAIAKSYFIFCESKRENINSVFLARRVDSSSIWRYNREYMYKIAWDRMISYKTTA